MRKPFSKLLCILIVLAILTMSTAALAEGEQSPVQISIGSKPKSYVTVPASGLDVDDLYLNNIRYEAKLNKEGDIRLHNIDLTVAARVTDILNTYNTQNPDIPFDTKSDLTIVAGKGIKFGTTQIQVPPDRDIADGILSKTLKFATDVRSVYSPVLINAIRAMMGTLPTDRQTQQFTKRLHSLMNDFSGAEAKFTKFMKEMYLCLYDMRAAIAKGELSSELLTKKEIRGLIDLFREILSKGGLDLDGLEFWDNNEGWTIWAIENSNTAVSTGSTFDLSDGTGKKLMINLSSIRKSTDVLEPEPEPPVEPFAPGPVTAPPVQPEIVSNSIIPPGIDEEFGTMTFVKDAVYLQDGTDGANPAPRLFINGALPGAKYERTCSTLPAELEFVPGDASVSHVAYIIGTPTYTNDGTYVTVSASTMHEGKAYEDSLVFIILVTEETSGDDISDDETSDEDTSGDDTSGDDTSGDDTSGGDTSGDETSGGETSGDETSGDETSGDETSDDETSGDEASGDETSDDETSGDETSGDETSGDDALDDETSDDET